MSVKVMVAASLIAAASIFITIESVEASFPTQRLNNFYLTNVTTGEPILQIVGQFMNNGTEKEDEVDISLTLFDKYDRIVGVAFQYNYDVKPNDTLPFRFRVPPSIVENGNFSNIQGYSVIVE